MHGENVGKPDPHAHIVNIGIDFRSDSPTVQVLAKAKTDPNGSPGYGWRSVEPKMEFAVQPNLKLVVFGIGSKGGGRNAPNTAISIRDIANRQGNGST